ncbi:ATP-binding protein [Streptoverticillium reticulum]|uniref:ATP-binding protein n=1 Tax=Streptoverticillium reticulum TaxID=1433415 RepID=UPI0039BF9400
MSTATLSTPPTAEPYEAAHAFELTAPAAPTTVRVAREFVTATLAATGHEPLAENARICVSDTVTNVVTHARVPTLTVEVTAHGHRIVIAVRDNDPRRMPWSRLPGPGDESGRGLMLVRCLSHAFGVSWIWDGLELVGKQVWFELRP